jgi:hypothetical protein
MNEKFSNIPADACRFDGGEVSFGDNGEGAKTVPVRIKARSGQPIEHQFWGKIVHDIAGMRLHKAKLPIDYAHDDEQVIGFLNHFDGSGGDLWASGALVPYKGDKAEEVIFKAAAGIPYEASIFWGGNGIKIEEVGAGMVAQVNGYQFDGPGLIVREWPLRGVAICPYGADAQTETTFKKSGETFSAMEYKAEDAKMETPEPVEAKVEEVKPEEAAPVEAVASPVEGAAVESSKVEEAEKVEAVAEPVAVIESAPVVEPRIDERAEFVRMRAEFGAAIASEVFAAGGGYEAAKERQRAILIEENARLREEIKELRPVGGVAARCSVTDESKRPTLLALCENGTRKNK